MIQPWRTLASKPVGNFRIFSIRSDLKVSPRTGQEHDFYVIDCTAWVNVIALTPDQKMVLIEQYRHGSNTIELEVPGGIMDPEDASPAATGVRELREETGYEGENARVLSEEFPNPAIMSNKCYTILIENCRLTHPVEFDSAEDLATRLVPVDEVPALVAANKIRHAIVVSALYHFELWRRGVESKG